MCGNAGVDAGVDAVAVAVAVAAGVDNDAGDLGSDFVDTPATCSGVGSPL